MGFPIVKTVSLAEKKNHKKAKILFITKAKSKIERIKRRLILDPSESEERKIKKDFKKNL